MISSTLLVVGKVRERQRKGGRRKGGRGEEGEGKGGEGSGKERRREINIHIEQDRFA